MAERRPNDDDVLRALADGADLPAGDAGPCPDPDLLSALLGDGLVPEERQRLEHHLARCLACVAVVADLAGDPEVMEEPAGRPRPTAAVVAAPDRTRWVLAAAATILIAIGAWALFRPPPESPPMTLSEASAVIRSAYPEACADLVPPTPDELAQPPTAAERGGVRLVTPTGVELTIRPTFRFAAQPGVTSYAVRLLDDRGDEVWATKTEASELPYPEGQAPLRRGASYLWEVAFERLGRQVGRRAFDVASDDTIERFADALAAIEAEAPKAQWLLLGAHLAIRREHWSQARQLARLALEARPDGELERATNVYVLTALGESAQVKGDG